MNTVKRSKDSMILMDKKPAALFEEAYPIGNGFSGAMVFGDPKKDRLELNHDKLWSGYPMDKLKKEPFNALERAKKLIKEGKYVEADADISQNFACYASQSYMPFGTLYIENLDFGGKVSGYKRTLDMKKAVFSVSYKIDNISYSVESFASHPDKTIVYRVSATDENGAPAKVLRMEIGMDSLLYSKTHVLGDDLCLEVECPVSSEQNVGRCERKTLYFDEHEKRGIRAIAMVQVITDGKKYNRLNALQTKDSSFVEIRICLSTSFNGYDKQPFTNGRDYKGDCQKLINALSERTYDDIRKDHIRDHSRYFNKVALDLGSDNKSNVPTQKRLEDFAKGVSDKALPALLFNFGRYLTIAASRKGSEAMNLQGIWSDKFAAPWQCNYTININLQMNYFATLQVGLAEMYEPLIRLIDEVSKQGVETAKVLYHADGWCAHHNTDLWRHTEPVIGIAQYLFWNAAGGWLCHHIWDYYEYTLDEKYLKKTALPIMEGAARFYLSQLDTVDGYRVVFPSTSPENSFMIGENRAAVSETTEMTMAIVRELFANLLKAAELLEYNSEVIESVKTELPCLMPTRIGSDGRVLEWYGERVEREINHRHISHMYALHPDNAITPEKTPDLAKACERSLEMRTDDGTGWSLAWKANCYARLWQGDHAFKLIKRQLVPMSGTDFNYYHGGTYANLFCAHPPFQIDGNFGAMSAIAEMLLQSDVDTVHIIPAIPVEWQNISVKGLCAKGSRVVDISVKDGKLAYCRIKGTKPERILVNGVDLTEKFVIGENILEFSV